MNLGRYLVVLRTPGVARVALFATTGRLPFAIVPLSVVLLMRGAYSRIFSLPTSYSKGG